MSYSDHEGGVGSSDGDQIRLLGGSLIAQVTSLTFQSLAMRNTPLRPPHSPHHRVLTI
jgi:hypothetical protein